MKYFTCFLFLLNFYPWEQSIRVAREQLIPNQRHRSTTIVRAFQPLPSDSPYCCQGVTSIFVVQLLCTILDCVLNILSDRSPAVSWLPQLAKPWFSAKRHYVIFSTGRSIWHWNIDLYKISNRHEAIWKRGLGYVVACECNALDSQVVQRSFSKFSTIMIIPRGLGSRKHYHLNPHDHAKNLFSRFWKKSVPVSNITPFWEQKTYNNRFSNSSVQGAIQSYR